MKIRAVTSKNVYPGFMYNSESNNPAICSASSQIPQAKTLSYTPVYYYPISFSGIHNSSKLRVLFGYDLPCIYSGLTMIDPKEFTKMQKRQLFSKTALDVLTEFDKYSDSFQGMEAKFIELLKERSSVHPEKTIKEIIEEVKPVYIRRLRKHQAPIFRELIDASHKLPEIHRNRFNLLMIETDKKLSNKPVFVPFSSYEFKYKLAKIKDDIMSSNLDLKSKKVINKLLKESKRLSNVTNSSTIDKQKEVINFIEIIIKKSVLKEHVELNNLIDTSKSRLNQEAIYTPFSRKSFLYDLSKIMEDMPNEKLYEKMMSIAQKLPTSQEFFPAYVMKLSGEQPDKIGQRLIWPSLASIEHLVPKSVGGADLMSNFAGATTVENSTRGSVTFVQQLKRRPDTPKYCQMYVDRLIDLYEQGVFARHGISPRYITDFANTIYAISEHRVKLDISRFAPNP